MPRSERALDRLTRDAAFAQNRDLVTGAGHHGRRRARAPATVDHDRHVVAELGDHAVGRLGRRPAVQVGAGRGNGTDPGGDELGHSVVRHAHTNRRPVAAAEVEVEVAATWDHQGEPSWPEAIGHGDPAFAEFEAADAFDLATKRMPQRTRWIISQRMAGVKMDEIGAELGISESRVSQILFEIRPELERVLVGQ